MTATQPLPSRPGWPGAHRRGVRIRLLADRGHLRPDALVKRQPPRDPGTDAIRTFRSEEVRQRPRHGLRLHEIVDVLVRRERSDTGDDPAVVQLITLSATVTTHHHRPQKSWSELSRHHAQWVGLAPRTHHDHPLTCGYLVGGIRTASPSAGFRRSGSCGFKSALDRRTVTALRTRHCQSSSSPAAQRDYVWISGCSPVEGTSGSSDLPGPFPAAGSGPD